MKKSTKHPESKTSPNRLSDPKDRLDAMLDEPSRNQRYGGMTMREMVRKVVLRREDETETGLGSLVKSVEMKAKV